ncbi:MAG: tRNA (adenosine(37)-N6)-threonylcarbamoyltransferase complex transferase subunit TsaD [Mollicutes bacterium PWAP]|nr:tRNA (adenosine(37)-N6)-threonylcarbamoyltransferase complex transferase subunit TsaD [Mollicutes bacterium PWAP]
MRILAFESSHDDSSISAYENGKILKEFSMTQTETHKKWGGTVPEIASRLHLNNLSILLENLKKEYELDSFDRIAYTYKPGLIGSLHMGQIMANTLGKILDKPVYKINHMHGHILAAGFNNELEFPSIALIVSGGHTQIWYLKNYNELKIIGQTKDDAVGEVYDKIARKLNIGFPGGPAIDKLFQNYKGEFINFDLLDDKTYNFSFSGIKTKIINYHHKLQQNNENINIQKIAASYQKSVVKILIQKTKRAIIEYKPKSIILGGGVSANSYLRKEFLKLHKNYKIPDLKYTTDNASMIAIACDLQFPEKN